MATRTITLQTEAQTIQFAETLAACAQAGDAFLLSGPLGAGKSTLARAFIRARAGDAALDVPSPSFTLVQTYDLTPPIAHFDLWRLSGPADVEELGLDAALSGIVLIEWPDRLGALAPPDAIQLSLTWSAQGGRIVNIDGPEPQIERLIA